MANRFRVLNQFILFRVHARRFIIAIVILFLLIGVIGWLWTPFLWAYIIAAPIAALGLADMLQKRNTIIRNFPVLGHFRFLSLSISPEIHQYFVEDDIEGKPFNKNQREIVDKRSEKQPDTHPFGTLLNVYEPTYEWAPHSIYPKEAGDTCPYVDIGGKECRQVYRAALFNISAMSFGSLSANAVRALNRGAKIGNFYHNTGEGGISDYHLESGADLVWEIGSGYFGCRTPEGDFCEASFERNAARNSVKMIEIKLSQGAKPGHGGVLPAKKNTPEIARIRGIKAHTEVISPAYHRCFSDSAGLLRFVRRLRKLSNGKPVGFKLCIGSKQEFTDICREIVATGIFPDFITVDGGEGGTGAAPFELSDSIGMPLEDALIFVSDTLNGYGLKKDITLIVAGKIVTGFDIVKAIALGADLCNSARGMMFALGCIQALKCDNNECPTGVTTHNPSLTRGLVIAPKSQRVANFQSETVRAATMLLAGMGLTRFDQLTRAHINKRVAPQLVQSFDELYPTVASGEWLKGECPP